MSFNVNGSFVDKLEWIKEGNENLKEIVQKFYCVFICEAWTNKIWTGMLCIERRE